MITAKTRLVGLIGYPLEHSVSPAMHNAALEAMGLDWCYLPLPVPPRRLLEALAGLRALGFVGVNVTLPYKEAVWGHLDFLSEQARRIGAVNTLLIGEQIAGYNTDADGFLRLLQENVPEGVAGKRALVLGAGGAARAVVYTLLREGLEVTVLNRSVARADRLVADMQETFPAAALTARPWEKATLLEELDRAGLLVHATSLGMWPQEECSPLPPEAPLRSGQVVVDLVYRPLETRLLRQARAAGAQAVGGLDMLIWQGAVALLLWSGREPPVSVMRRAAQESL